MDEPDRPFSDDVKVLAADLGAETMFILGRSRQPPGFEEPPEREFSDEELLRMGYAAADDDMPLPDDDGLPMTDAEVQRLMDALRDPALCV